jgi:hypothetical protein
MKAAFTAKDKLEAEHMQVTCLIRKGEHESENDLQ